MITEINEPPYENAFTRVMDKLQRVRNKLPLWCRTKTMQQQEAPMQRVVRAVVLEYMATTLFVFYACASVVAANFWVIQTASANLLAGIVQGFAIATFVYAIGHTSGGHINPAVTFAMLISGNIGLIRGLFYIMFQLVGGITGAALLSGVLPGQYEGELGTTTLGPGVSRFQGFIFELIITFSLLFTIFGTALNKDAAATGLPSLAPIPIGFSITIGVCVAYSFTGGSLNPARTFGPAVISHTWQSHYVYWAGPMGAALIIGLLERYLAIFSAGQRRVIKNRFIRRINEFNYKPNPVAGQNGYPAAPVQQMGGAPIHTSPNSVRHRNSMSLAPPEPGTGLF